MNLSKALLLACAFAMATESAHSAGLEPIKPVAHVDLPRFMGNWYVIATIPTMFEKSAHNAVETYKLDPDGHVATSFRFRNGPGQSGKGHPLDRLREGRLWKCGVGRAGVLADQGAIHRGLSEGGLQPDDRRPGRPRLYLDHRADPGHHQIRLRRPPGTRNRHGLSAIEDSQGTPSMAGIEQLILGSTQGNWRGDVEASGKRVRGVVEAVMSINRAGGR
jgi:hypothetical protein